MATGKVESKSASIDDFIQDVMRTASPMLCRDPENDVWLDSDELDWETGGSRRKSAVSHGFVREGLEALSRSVAVGLPREPLLAGAEGAAVAFPDHALPQPRRRQRDRAGWSRERKRRFFTRFVPLVILLLSALTLGSWYAVNDLSAAPVTSNELLEPSPPIPDDLRFPIPTQAPTLEPSTPLASDFPALTERPLQARTLQEQSVAIEEVPVAPPEPAYEEIIWRESAAIGQTNNGRLVDGVRLPIEGPDWVTWDPVHDHKPNRQGRLWGTDDLVRVVVTVLEDYRVAHPDAPKVLIGDLSRKNGGPLDQHVSHENGLDVDIYYPRLDARLRAPKTVAQIDHQLSQYLVDAFVAAGAELVLVGPDTRLTGPRGVVLPYTGHNNHLHVRLPNS